MAVYSTTPKIGAQPLDTPSATQGPHDLMERCHAGGDTGYGAAFVYAKASMALLQYDAAWVKSTGGATKTMETAYKTPGLIAFPQVAFTIDYYGWMQVYGKPLVRLTPATEKDTPLYIHASDGVLSGVTSSAQVLGLSAVTSVTTTVGAVTCIANFPIVKWGAGLSEI